MAEHINNLDLFGSGGHRWLWDSPAQAVKQVATVGVQGAAAMVLWNGPRPGVVSGILRGSGSNRAGADYALSQLEEAIEKLVQSGEAVGWEDDHGHQGQSLRVVRYQRQGHRDYGATGANTYEAWQSYHCVVSEQEGNV